jgi:uncharacterized membrane protein
MKGEVGMERLAADLAVERYFAPQPGQGVVGTLYVVVLVAGVFLAVALTVLFARIVIERPALNGASSEAHTGATPSASAQGRPSGFGAIEAPPSSGGEHP